MSLDGCSLAKIAYSLGRAINQNLKEQRLTKPNSLTIDHYYSPQVVRTTAPRLNDSAPRSLATAHR